MEANSLKFILLIILTVITQFIYGQSTIHIAGAMSNIMREGDLSSHINVDILAKDGLYGLGPIAGLKGEMMIVNGKTYTSTIQDGKVYNTADSISQAAMLVYVNTQHWQKIDTTVTLNNYSELETFIAQLAKRKGYDLTIPFAFRIESKVPTVKFHIIGWKDGVQHTMDNHKQFAINQSPKNANVELLGFYSDHHHSIFTHHSTNMHIHIRNKNENTIGHLDDIKIQGIITVFLSK